jgi:hypothetical protein
MLPQAVRRPLGNRISTVTPLNVGVATTIYPGSLTDFRRGERLRNLGNLTHNGTSIPGGIEMMMTGFISLNRPNVTNVSNQPWCAIKLVTELPLVRVNALRRFMALGNL